MVVLLEKAGSCRGRGSYKGTLMAQFYSTRQVAGFLGIKPDRLQKAVWTGRVTPPGKSPSGQYLWIKSDIERVSWVLLRQSADTALGEQGNKR